MPEKKTASKTTKSTATKKAEAPKAEAPAPEPETEPERPGGIDSPPAKAVVRQASSRSAPASVGADGESAVTPNNPPKKALLS